MSAQNCKKNSFVVILSIWWIKFKVESNVVIRILLKCSSSKFYCHNLWNSYAVNIVLISEYIYIYIYILSLNKLYTRQSGLVDPSSPI